MVWKTLVFSLYCSHLIPLMRFLPRPLACGVEGTDLEIHEEYQQSEFLLIKATSVTTLRQFLSSDFTCMVRSGIQGEFLLPIRLSSHQHWKQ
ncbi:hypothetical protein CC78DRAFT_18349 [Lojkania enalia]|uniref:Secreted protein n=1 Tax=Lojkania enalia TaxID=147567 RepID=A0A9P4N3B4_9PLEO|nr:hypothetical protein CC78DRAFT_18349 [Didymosphaeria enalia]